MFFFLICRPPPISTRTYPPFPSPTRFRSVWHMDASLADSTANGNDGSNFGTTADAGFLGDARHFDGATTWIDAGAGPSLALAGSLTVERSEEHTSELQSLMRISYAVFCLKKKKIN